MWIGVAVGAALTPLRTWYQYRTNRKLFANDYLILSAFIFHVATAAVNQIMIAPMYEVVLVSSLLRPPGADFVETANFFLRLQFAVDLLLWTTTWLVKFSLLSFFGGVPDADILVDHVFFDGGDVYLCCRAANVCVRSTVEVFYYWYCYLIVSV